MTLGVLPYIIATHELVVPRSIPITGPVFLVEKLVNKNLLKVFLNIIILINNYYKVKGYRNLAIHIIILIIYQVTKYNYLEFLIFNKFNKI
jgi:hypothetical protein